MISERNVTRVGTNETPAIKTRGIACVLLHAMLQDMYKCGTMCRVSYSTLGKANSVSFSLSVSL